jgi:E3 ubiquitin-protein ligase HECTD2
MNADNWPSKVQERDTMPTYLISPPQVGGGWSFDATSSTQGPATYSGSLPERDLSPLDQMNRAGFRGSVPSAPTRPPPPVPRGTDTGLPPTHYARSQTAEITMNGSQNPRIQGRTSDDGDEGYPRGDESIFRPLEKYILDCFASWECVNNSFIMDRPILPTRAASEGTKEGCKSVKGTSKHHAAPLSGLDAKTLLLGDFAENGSWWTGSQGQARRTGGSPHRRDRSADCVSGSRGRGIVNANASCVDWAEISRWYELLLGAGKDWRSKWQEAEGIHSDVDGGCVQGGISTEGERAGVVRDIQHIGSEIGDARWRVHRVLLKATENLLKRPGRPLNSPQDIHFILIILANPLLYPSSLPRIHPSPSPRERESSVSQRRPAVPKGNPQHSRKSPTALGPGLHPGIIKRILGLLSNLPNECHHGLVSWFSQLSTNHFRRIVELVGSFVTYRLARQHATKRSDNADPTSGLVPNLTGPGVGSHAHLHAALGISGSSKNSDSKQNSMFYNDDWQIKAAARVMALLFSANNSSNRRKINSNVVGALDAEITNAPPATRHQIVPTSDFYNTLLDYSDLIADFEAWESRRGKFSFCQYPFFLSIWAKIHIMEYDARRQMEVKAREAFFDSIMSRRAISQYLVLKVRRDCLVEDSLRGVSEVVGSGQEDIKKGLRIEFLGEEGVDAGGLRKEWFLLLVRDIFDPDHGGWH